MSIVHMCYPKGSNPPNTGPHRNRLGESSLRDRTDTRLRRYNCHTPRDIHDTHPHSERNRLSSSQHSRKVVINCNPCRLNNYPARHNRDIAWDRILHWRLQWLTVGQVRPLLMPFLCAGVRIRATEMVSAVRIPSKSLRIWYFFFFWVFSVFLYSR